MSHIFPITSYEEIHKIVVLSQSKNSLYNHYAGAWNAIAYRFKEAEDQSDAFISCIDNNGSTPPPNERYLQEKILFDFFSSCFSTFESAFYGLYTIGSFISPKDFPLTAVKDQQKVSPTRTRDLYMDTFSKDKIVNSFNALFTDVEYQKLRNTRNILTHRAAPGRRIYVSMEDTKGPMTEWKLNNMVVDRNLITNSKSELSRLLFYLLDNSALFVKAHLSK